MNSKLRRLIEGKTKFSQFVYGVIDGLPMLNWLNIPRAVLKQFPQIGTRELLAESVKRTDPIRLLTGVIVTALILSGHLTLETLGEAVETFTKVMAFLSQLLGA